MDREAREIYELYCRCFPHFYMDFEPFCRRLSLTGPCQRVLHREGGTLAGFCLTSPGAIRLLCVDKPFREKGIGSALLAKAEEIRRGDSQRLSLGLGDSYLFQGVPLLEENMPAFFEHRGYAAPWVSEDLTLNKSPLPAPPCAPGMAFRLAVPEDRPALLEAVDKVDSDWVPYFAESDSPVLLACQDGKLLGFAFVGASDEVFAPAPGTRMAAIGCVGVVPEARCQGIGLKMVETAAQNLMEQGFDEVYIGYTHLAHWYARLGFAQRVRCWMGEKTLTD